MFDFFSEKNLIREKFYVDDKNDIKQECETLRNFLLFWLDAIYKNIE